MLCIYSAILWVVNLRRNTKKFGSNPKFYKEMEISQLLSDIKGHHVVYLQSQGKLAVEYIAFGNTGLNSKKFDALCPPCSVFI